MAKRSKTAKKKTTSKAKAKRAKSSNGNGANLGFEATLWAAADKLRGHMDAAMTAIERDNPNVKGVLAKDYARPALDKTKLGEIIDLIGTIGLGDKASRSKDILGRVYEFYRKTKKDKMGHQLNGV